MKQNIPGPSLLEELPLPVVSTHLCQCLACYDENSVCDSPCFMLPHKQSSPRKGSHSLPLLRSSLRKLSTNQQNIQKVTARNTIQGGAQAGLQLFIRKRMQLLSITGINCFTHNGKPTCETVYSCITINYCIQK